MKNKNKKLFESILYYVWCVRFEIEDFESQSTLKHYEKFLKETEAHFGDCTSDAITCSRCTLQELEIESQKLYNFLELDGYEEIKQMTNRETVICKTCKKEYDSVWSDKIGTEQGHGCASNVDFQNNRITGHYGSLKFDFDIFEFKNEEVPDYVENGTICDECIQKLLNDDSIVKTGGGVL